MANYYLGDNGELVSAKKKKKKQGTNYVLQDDGSLSVSKQEESYVSEDDIAPVDTSKRVKDLTKDEYMSFVKKSVAALYNQEKEKNKDTVTKPIDKSSKKNFDLSKLSSAERTKAVAIMASGMEYTAKDYQDALVRDAKDNPSEETRNVAMIASGMETLGVSNVESSKEELTTVRRALEKIVVSHPENIEKVNAILSEVSYPLSKEMESLLKKKGIHDPDTAVKNAHEQKEKAIEAAQKQAIAQRVRGSGKWSDKEGAFTPALLKDGYQFGDVALSLLGTTIDVGVNAAAGIAEIPEAVVDAGAWLVGGAADLVGADGLKDDMSSFIAKNIIKSENLTNWGIDNASFFGETLDGFAQSGGQLLATYGLSSVGVPWFVTTGLISFGGQVDTALNEGASFWEAGGSAVITAAADILTEKMFRGSGLGEKGLIKTDNWTKAIANKSVKLAADYGITLATEGAEELIAGIISNMGTTLYKDGDWKDIVFSEEAFEDYFKQALGGAILGGVANTKKAVSSSKQGTDFNTGLTSSEQKVFDKVYNEAVEAKTKENGGKITKTEKNKLYETIMNNLQKGYVSTDTIEEVLGDENYTSYKSALDNETSLKEEFDTLNKMKQSEMTGEQIDRRAELKQQLEELKNNSETEGLKTKLSDSVFSIIEGESAKLKRGSFLNESYNEIKRKSQAFEADLSKYEGKKRVAVERAINSGVLNNTNRSHDLVDFLAEIEAEKDITFDYVNNEKLKESGYAIDGKTVNGFVDTSKGAVTINVQSAKAWQSVVGHEVTHILEGTAHYEQLQKALYAHAESKGELASRKQALTELYKNMDADIDAELTADLVGDYLFTDSDFIRNLTTNKPLFKKIYDEIKYLCKKATGKELTEIEKVKREFDKAWDELALNESLKNEATDTEINDVDYSVSVEDKPTLDLLNKQVEKGEYDAENNPDGGYYVTYKSMSFWGYDEDGNAILRSPMAEYVDGELSNAYLIPKDKSKLNWYKATETIDEKTGLPSGLMVKTKKPGNKSYTYLPAAENQHLIAEDWSNLYFNLQKKVLKNGKWVNSDVPARYNPYEHSSNSMLNDQFSAAYLRDNLVTVKMYVPVSEDNGAFRAQYSKDPTGWADWKTGTVAGKINKQKDLQRRVYLSRYAAPVEIVPDSEVAQAYKEYIDGTDVAIPDNVVSPSLLNELKKAGVPITESGKVKYSVSEDSNGNELSLAVQRRFANSKAVDKNGKLKVLYHGTYGGEFYTFDKSKGSVEGDFGSGFYFTDSEYDASDNYEGGGPDFDNKVARRAEQIESEEGIDYHEAEKRAREELYKGSNLFEVYLNIENPAIVGETNLFDYDSFAEEYDRDDYDSDEDYESDIEYRIADEIDSIIWDIEKNVDIYSTDGIAEVLWNAVNEGGIDVEQLKANINNLYLEDNDGNFVGGEVTRQIIESLGYDGIIDNTVSTKFNMNIVDGTTHYIVFKPNQIKSIDNQNPTDDPDIRYSISDIAPTNREPIISKLTGKEISEQTYATLDRLQRGEPVALEDLDSLPEVIEGKEKMRDYTDDFLKNYPEFKEVPIKDLGTHLIKSAEREQMRNEVLNKRLNSGSFTGLDIDGNEVYNGSVKKGKRLDIVIGLPAAGKSTSIVLPLSQYYKSVVVDSDIVKGELPEFNKGWGASLVHEESSEINLKMLGRELELGNNIVLPIVGAKASSVEKYLELAKLNKYEVHLHLNELNSSKAMSRNLGRYFSQGRFIPPEIAWEKGDKPNAVYEELKNRGDFSGYSHWNNDVPKGQRPTLVEVSGNNRAYSKYSNSWRAVRGTDAQRNDSESQSRESQIAPIKETSSVDGVFFDGESHSLSRKGEKFAPTGDYSTPLYETSLAPIQEDITENSALEAPSVEENASVAKTVEAPMPNEIVPMTEEEANALQDEKAQADAKLEGEPKTRKQLHNNIINDVKATFESGGYDFDDVLGHAKDLSTFSTVDNTPQRVMEKALGYKEGQILSDITVNRVAQNETEGIKWLNSYTDRKNGLLAHLSKQYNIKPGSKESAAAQMYAEGFYVTENNDIVEYGDKELAADFPNAKVRENIKGLASDPRIREIYDLTLNAINESRTRNAYPEIQRLDNYFLHFRAMDDTFSRLGLPFNPNDIRAKDLPTDLNGVTADLKPGQPYFASAMHRKGKRTSFDLLGGLERYLTSAKNQIYHIDDIQTLRALRNYIADNYGQANGLEGIDALTEEEAQEKIEQVYSSHLSTFAKFLNEEANVLAGKTALIDRGLEGVIGRRGMTFMDSVRKQVGTNMIGFNVSSSMTNFLAGVQAIAKTNKFACIKSLAQTTSSKIGSIFGKTDSFVENNPTIIRRKGAERFYRTPFQKAGDAGYVLMSAVDNVTTEFIVRAKYNEFIKKGMSEQQAITEADKWTSRLMGDRSLGQMPQLYNSKTLGLITQFQLEVRNQLDSQFYDTVKESKASTEDIENGLARNAKTAAKVTKTFFELAVLQHLFGKGFEAVAGYNPAFDIISVLTTALGFDDDEDSEDTFLDNIEQGFLELLEDLPYTSAITGGGRIPISSALPIKELVNGKDEYGNEKSRWDIVKETAPYYFLPTGYGQIKKTAKGLEMFNTDEDHPIAGSYTDSGSMRFPVEDTFGNRVKAALFGQYANENAREYFDNDYAPLKEKQIQEYIDVEMPIADYWKYREGLKGLKTNAEKADYIDSLDIKNWQKTLLMNNILDRKEDIDMSDYDDYGSFEEFDFAQSEPEKYAFAKSVGGYSSYKSYTKDLYKIKADKDENGKSISGSRKEKVINYINELDADYGAKIVLFKSEYPADDTYNADIVEYINGLDGLTYKERVTIYEELGFTVKDGYVYWD